MEEDMEVPIFSRWWEVALFLLLGLILIPLAILMYSWDVLMGIFKKDKVDD